MSGPRARFARFASDTWPAIGLLLMGACFYGTAWLPQNPGQGHPGWSILVAAVLAPVGAFGVAMLSRTPRGLPLRLLIAILVAGATLGLILAPALVASWR